MIDANLLQKETYFSYVQKKFTFHLMIFWVALMTNSGTWGLAIKRLKLTLSTLSASSQTCIPRDSNTSTQPRYLTGKVQVPARTAASSACHWCGRADSGGEPLRRRNDSRNERRSRSMPARGGDSAAPARARRNDARTDDFCNTNAITISTIYNRSPITLHFIIKR